MDLTKHLEKAEDAIRRKNFDYGIDLYRQLLSVSPGDYGARLGFHRALVRRHEAKPTPTWQAKIQGGPQLALAKTYRAAKNFQKESEAIEAYLAFDPLNESSKLALGESLERANLPDAALAVYESLAESNAESFEAWKRAGMLLARKREIQRALDCYTKALDLNPRDQEAIKARKDLAAEGALQRSGLETGVHSRDLMKDKEAAAQLERGQRLLHTAEEIDAEIDRLMGEMATNPGDVKVLGELSKLHERKNDAEAALDCVERALEYAPNDFDLKTRRATLRARVLDREIERLRGKATTDPAAAQALAKAEQEKLSFEVEETRKLATEHPTDMALRYKLGRLLLKVGDLDSAVGELQKAVTDPRVRTDALVGLGQAFFKKGIFDLARKQLEKALEGLPAQSPRYKEVLYNLGVISEKTGATADALGFYLRIYEVDIAYRDVGDKVARLQKGGGA